MFLTEDSRGVLGWQWSLPLCECKLFQAHFISTTRVGICKYHAEDEYWLQTFWPWTGLEVGKCGRAGVLWKVNRLSLPTPLSQANRIREHSSREAIEVGAGRERSLRNGHWLGLQNQLLASLGGKKGCRSYLLRRGSQDWPRRRWIQMLPPPASPLKENFALCKIKEPSVGQAGTTASSTHTPMEVNRSLDVSSWNRGWDEMHKWMASAITLWARIQQRTKSSAIIGKITPWKACS